jgi:hypothetical protein
MWLVGQIRFLGGGGGGGGGGAISLPVIVVKKAMMYGGLRDLGQEIFG